MKKLKVQNSDIALFFPQKRWDGKIIGINFLEEPSETMREKVLEHFREHNQVIEQGYQEYGPEVLEILTENNYPEKHIEDK